MKTKIMLLTLAVTLASCKTVEPVKSPATTPSTLTTDWVIQSNDIAEQYTRSYSTLYPELGSSLGYQEYDKQGMNLTSESSDKGIALQKVWQKKLKKLLQQTTDKNLKVDLLILLGQVEDDLELEAVHAKMGVLNFRQASKSVYNSLLGLINEQSPANRKMDGVSRFKYYMSEEGKSDLIQSYQDEIQWTLDKYQNQETFYPFVGEIKKYLSNSPAYVGGVKELLAQSGRDDWKSDFERFEAKVAQYDAYVSEHVLPKARQTPNEPIALYQLNLKSVGVDAKPETLIKNGEAAFATIYKDFSALAAKIAKKNQLKKSDPAAVIGFLKSKQVASIEGVSTLYNGASDRLEGIIRANNLVSLPKKPLKIRFAGDAESKAAPVPHLIPPPLIDNNGIVPEFVVPTSSTGQLPFDDFGYESAATILTAHEGRPGHDLQFSKMIENPVSIVRARYAMNSVNVEGWALYAEDLVYPYLTDEEKLVALQTRLWRVARYFLDPMVQLGKAGQDKVVEVFNGKLGVSKTMAGLEYNRYAFRSPGQATAYYHGLLNIIELKKDFSAEYGQLNLMCFNDTLLSFGLLPHKQIRLFKEQFKSCAM